LTVGAAEEEHRVQLDPVRRVTGGMWSVEKPTPLIVASPLKGWKGLSEEGWRPLQSRKALRASRIIFFSAGWAPTQAGSGNSTIIVSE
jgi:hypothetical protein